MAKLQFKGCYVSFDYVIWDRFGTSSSAGAHLMAYLGLLAPALKPSNPLFAYLPMSSLYSLVNIL